MRLIDPLHVSDPYTKMNKCRIKSLPAVGGPTIAAMPFSADNKLYAGVKESTPTISIKKGLTQPTITPK